MAAPGFFNDNINRTYPFVVGSTGVNVPSSGAVTMLQLPDSFVADCGFTVGSSKTFDPAAHTVYLYEIRRPSTNVLEFEFRCSDSVLLSRPLVVTRAPGDKFKTYFVDSPRAYESDPEYVTSGWPYWYGYVVFGEFADVTDRLSVGQTITRSSSSQSIVHPTLITNLTGSRVTSFNVANKDRTRALVPVGCSELEWDFDIGEIYIVSQGLTGFFSLQQGYNLSISSSAANDTWTFTPAVNGGEGRPCEEVPRFEGETPPIGSSNNRLSGDFLCNEVYRTVNGVPGPNFNLLSGPGVSIISDAESHTVSVNVDSSFLAVCGEDIVDVSESV
jgi:hypothetical protein